MSAPKVFFNCNIVSDLRRHDLEKGSFFQFNVATGRSAYNGKEEGKGKDKPMFWSLSKFVNKEQADKFAEIYKKGMSINVVGWMDYDIDKNDDKKKHYKINVDELEITRWPANSQPEAKQPETYAMPTMPTPEAPTEKEGDLPF